MADETLTDIGKRTKLDTERERVKARLSDLRKKETELIAAKKQSLEKSLFGLSSVTSSDPGQIIAYRDAQDRAARLTIAADAEEVFAAAVRSDDKTLAAAGKAEYVKQHPAAGDDLDDLAKLQQYDSFGAGLSYITT